MLVYQAAMDKLMTLLTTEYSYPDVEDPAKESRKLACGSCILETLPLSTTQPVTTMKVKITTLIVPNKFCSLTPQCGTNVCISVIKVMSAIAMPRSSHSEACRS